MGRRPCAHRDQGQGKGGACTYPLEHRCSRLIRSSNRCSNCADITRIAQSARYKICRSPGRRTSWAVLSDVLVQPLPLSLDDLLVVIKRKMPAKQTLPSTARRTTRLD